LFEVFVCENNPHSLFFFGVGGPIALIIVIAYTTYIIGPSALLGCFIFLIMFPIQVCKVIFSHFFVSRLPAYHLWMTLFTKNKMQNPGSRG
jgi:Na+/melibiose symporter-like transporter